MANFLPGNSQQWQLDGRNVVNQNANQAGTVGHYSLQQVDAYTTRFEVRQGDVWQNPPYTDPSNNRDEVSIGLTAADCFAEGVPCTMQFIVNFLPGTVSTAGFCDITQVHATTDTPPSPFYIGFDAGDYLNVVRQAPSISYESLYRTPTPIVRGTDYVIKAEVMMGPAGSGFVRVWINGAQYVNFNGAIGATGSLYWWKWGLYRTNVAETLAATFRNVTLTFP